MRKTSAYLIRLIGEGVRRVIADQEPEHRPFLSLGKGRGGGEPYSKWQPTGVYRKVMGGG